MSRQWRYCYLCGKVDDNVPVFKFPEDSRFQQWLKFCSISSLEYRKGMKLCSKHFSQEFVIFSEKRSSLKQYAIPTLRVDREKSYIQRLNARKLPPGGKPQMAARVCSNFLNILKNSHENDPLLSEETFNLVNESLNEYPYDSSCTIVSGETLEPEETSCDIQTEFKIEASSVSDSSETDTASSPYETFCEEVISSEAGSDDEDLNIISAETVLIEEEEPSESLTSVKKIFLPETSQKVHTPRYIGDIRMSDLDSPTKRSRCLKLIKNRYTAMQKQIHALKRKNRVMCQKFRTINVFIEDLLQQNLISKKTAKKYSYKITEKQLRKRGPKIT